MYHVRLTVYADKNAIAAKFAERVAETCSPNCDLRTARLKSDYAAMGTKYVGPPYSDDHAFAVALVDKIIRESVWLGRMFSQCNGFQVVAASDN